MSAEEAASVAVLAAVAGVAGLNGVFEGPPSSASLPYAELGEMIAGDWGTKDRAGRELRVLVTVHDAGQRATRVRALAADVGAAIEALPRDLGGWRIASVAPVRSRVGARSAGRWAAAIEYRIRMMEDL